MENKEMDEHMYGKMLVLSEEIRKTLKKVDTKTKKIINMGYSTLRKEKKMQVDEKTIFYLNYARTYIKN